MANNPPKLYVDALSSALKTQILTVATELGLKSVNIGDWTALPSPEDYSAAMPMVFVSFLSTAQPELLMSRMRVEYHFRVRYFRAQLDTDLGTSAKLTNVACERIWQVLQTGTNSTRPLIPDWFSTAIPGFEYESIIVNGPNMTNEDNAHLNFLEYRVNCAWLDLSITGQSRVYVT